MGLFGGSGGSANLQHSSSISFIPSLVLGSRDTSLENPVTSSNPQSATQTQKDDGSLTVPFGGGGYSIPLPSAQGIEATTIPDEIKYSSSGMFDDKTMLIMGVIGVILLIFFKSKG